MRCRSYDHMRTTGSFIVWLQVDCKPTHIFSGILNMQNGKLLRNHSCNSWGQWCTKYGQRADQWEHPTSGGGSNGVSCKNFKEMIKLTKIWFPFCYHNVLSFSTMPVVKILVPAESDHALCASPFPKRPHLATSVSLSPSPSWAKVANRDQESYYRLLLFLIISLLTSDDEINVEH